MPDRLLTLWTTAAWRESTRVGAETVDLAHLYLGLIAIGGSAARLLGRHGITLASARARVHEAGGVGPAGRAGVRLPPPLPLMEVGDPRWTASPAADDLVRRTRAADTYGLLVTLLKEPSGTVRRLVHADAVTPQELVPALKEGADDPYAAEPVPVDTALLAAPAGAQRVRHFMSAPAALVADALADPALLAVWAYDPARASVSGGETITHLRGGTAMTLRAHHTRRREGDAEVITWIHELLDAPQGGGPLLYDRFDVHPAPGGCEVVRTSGRRRLGLLGRLMAPLNDSFAGWGMRHGTQAIALAVADRLG